MMEVKVSKLRAIFDDFTSNTVLGSASIAILTEIQGLEPNYPCCTANHPSGLPKFLQSTWVTVGDSGIMHALLSPSTVETTLKNGAGVKIECQTDYPFADILVYNVTSDQAIDLFVRIPEWAHLARLESSHGTNQSSNGLLRLNLPSGESRVVYTLETDIRVVPRANDTVAVYRGQLLYALEIGSRTTSTLPSNYKTNQTYPEDYAPPEVRDYNMINTTPWNVAIDPTTLEFWPGTPESSVPEDASGELPGPIFAPGAPPTSMTAKACLIDWPLLGSGSVPDAPPVGVNRKCLGEAFDARLVPYGSAKLRMAELPTIELSRPEISVDTGARRFVPTLVQKCLILALFITVVECVRRRVRNVGETRRAGVVGEAGIKYPDSGYMKAQSS
jgi:hypothetical protein